MDEKQAGFIFMMSLLSQINLYSWQLGQQEVRKSMGKDVRQWPVLVCSIKEQEAVQMAMNCIAMPLGRA